MHGPAATSATVDPLTVHTPGGDADRPTGRPEVADTVSSTDPSVSSTSSSGSNEICCGTATSVSTRPGTCWSSALSAVPSAPRPSEPQHQATAAPSTEQACRLPMTIWRTSPGGDATSAGSAWSTPGSKPLPSSPAVLSPPQQ